MSLGRSKKRASTKGTTAPAIKTEAKTLKGVFIISAELREKLLIAFGEMPRKYSGMLNPLEQELTQAYRIEELTLNVPVASKSTPVPALAPTPKSKVEKDE